MKVFLDLDGVLVDFVGGACEVHDEPNPYNDPKNWGKFGLPELFNMDEHRFWFPLGYEFWRDLKPMSDGKKILDLFSTRFGIGNIALLSSPPSVQGARDGKQKWVDRNLPILKRRLILASCKEFMAGPDKLLVDDLPENVEKFRAAGGHAILVPRPWNDLYKLNTLEYLTQQVGELVLNVLGSLVPLEGGVIGE